MLAGFLALTRSGAAEPATNSPTANRSIQEWSLEQLVNAEVTSVSKKKTFLEDSPAAIAVVTQDDVRRLGITSIPEALRLVPGLDVARLDGTKWAVSSRGFNSQYANKLLVLMDGRSVYTPAFGGVYWNVQDLLLEDLDRIEVIRGPGATLWGANAVNGVINISSKNSKDTQGTLVTSSIGTEDQPSVGVRYGGQVTPELHYRAYVKAFNRDGLVDAQGNGTPDDSRSVRTGFRTDWSPEDNLVTLQGDYYYLRKREAVTVPLLTPPFAQNVIGEEMDKGYNVLSRWTHTFSDESHLSLQAYFDHFREEQGLTLEKRDTADVQLEHRFPLGSWNDVMWGLGYRFSEDDFNGTELVTWNPESRGLNLYTAFVQDEITIVPDHLHFTIGTKIEHNDFTDWEFQPSARILWTPTEAHSVWGAISHAVGTPGRFQHGGRLNMPGFQPPFSPPFQPALLGDSHLESETLDSLELGYRVKVSADLSFDVTGFYNTYAHLHVPAAGANFFEPTPAPGHIVMPLYWQNTAGGHTYGTELAAQWKPMDWWRLTASYSWLQMDLYGDSQTPKANPHHQASLRLDWQLPWHLEFSTAAYFVDQVDAAQGPAAVRIPAYIRCDAGLIWRPTQALEIGIWGQNLFDDRHPEYPALNTTSRTEVPRSVLAKITWRF